MSWLDELLKDAMNRGDFDNLPSAGKKLSLERDPHTPDDMKLAYKMMKDNDLVPDWIAQGKSLEARLEKLEIRIERAKRGELSASALADLRESVRRYNSEILTWNLKLPPGMAHRRQLKFEA